MHLLLECKTVSAIGQRLSTVPSGLQLNHSDNPLQFIIELIMHAKAIENSAEVTADRLITMVRIIFEKFSALFFDLTGGIHERNERQYESIGAILAALQSQLSFAEIIAPLSIDASAETFGMKLCKFYEQ